MVCDCMHLNLKILSRENDSGREMAMELVITKGVSDCVHLKLKILSRERERERWEGSV